MDAEPATGDRTGSFRLPVTACAKLFAYHANPGEFHAWNRLRLDNDVVSHILLSLHALGLEFRGILVGTLSFSHADGSDLAALTSEFFQVNYLDDPEEVRARFLPWLESGFAKGVEVWQKTL